MAEKRGNIFEKNRRGQVTIFIIIGIIIVAAVILAVSFFPGIRTAISGQEETPESYIQTCIEKDIAETAEKISLQGGSSDPEYYALYEGTKIQYLCYTSEDRKLCSLQKPGLKKLIETEIRDAIDDRVDACFDALKGSYERKNYAVEISLGEKTVELFPEKVVSTFDYSAILTKGEETLEHDSFAVTVNSNLYELASIADSIARLESEAGNIEPAGYMTIYPYLKVERAGKSDGTKVYILTHKKTGAKFQFASRSLVSPAGLL
jgi:hypothetical protein